MTIWEAAVAAHEQRVAAEQAAAAQALADRIARARQQLQGLVGPDVTLPPHDLVHELGIIIHDGERGLLFTEQGGSQIVRYAVREPDGQIGIRGNPLGGLADLGQVLTTS